MSETPDFSAAEYGRDMDTSALAFSLGHWAPKAAPLEVPRQIVERRSASRRPWLELIVSPHA